MVQQKYTKFFSYYNGQLMSSVTNVSVDFETGDQDVDTMANGFSGVSEGSIKCQVTVKSAIPDDGFDRDSIFDDAEQRNPIELTFFGAGRKFTAKGFIKKINMQQGVDAMADIDFSATCEWFRA